MKTKELKFKVGDKVRVKSLEWYNENKDGSGEITAKEGEKFGVFHPNMRYWCGDVIKINSVINFGYRSNNCWRWYDWMLEDDVVTEEKQEVEQFEAVTEEKQEVEQLNKNNMETKKMTKEEVLEHLNMTKILCTSVEETVRVQKKLFELGIKWAGDEGTDDVVNEDAFLLFIENNNLFFDGDISYWIRDESRKIEPREILAIQIKEQPKPKFDPNTLKTFDKVLVRRNKTSVWLARFYEYKDDVDFHVTNGGAWQYCIPYNDDTKHLHRTNNEAPEFYKLD